MFAPLGIRAFSTFPKAPVRISVTGSSGNIGYALLFRIASGEMLGKDQPVILQLHDLPVAQNALKGVCMELRDAAFPLLYDVVATDNYGVAFKDADFAMLVGAKPRGPGMERGDLLKDNGKIFSEVGKAMNDHAKRSCRTLVVGNPANTNCLIAASNCPGIPKANFNAMTRLDHSRALYQIAAKLDCRVTDIDRLCVWGNHSSTMYPDLAHITVNGKPLLSQVSEEWVNETFMPTVQKRGAAIIKARKLSSAASAAAAAIDHMHDWALGSKGKWVSMAIPSEGNNYGVPAGLVYSFPCVCENGSYRVVEGLPVSDKARVKLDTTAKELLQEKEAVKNLL